MDGQTDDVRTSVGQASVAAHATAPVRAAPDPLATGEGQSGQREYIRGSAGVQLHRGQARRIFVVVLLVLLAAVLVALTAEAATQNARSRRLQHDGVKVQVTVTHCLGQASGTGITVVGYTCHGTFRLHGRTFVDPIRGTSRLYPRGVTLAGVTDPNQPTILSTRAAVEGAPSLWRALVAPECVVTLLMIVIGVYAYWRRWAR